MSELFSFARRKNEETLREASDGNNHGPLPSRPRAVSVGTVTGAEGTSRLFPPRESPRSFAFRNLYDNLHLVAGHVPRRIVLAATSLEEDIEEVIDGLARHAVACGRGVLTAALELHGERPVLHVRDRNDEPFAVDLSAGNLPLPLDDIFHARANGDLMLVGGPPLTRSIHSALLASECDGLVLVAKPMATRRSHLRVAIERANRAGCRTLGVVMNENDPKPRLPENRFSRLRGMFRRRK